MFVYLLIHYGNKTGYKEWPLCDALLKYQAFGIPNVDLIIVFGSSRRKKDYGENKENISLALSKLPAK